MKIPLQDIKSQNSKLKFQLLKALNKQIKSGIFVSNSEVELFEKNFANYVGTKYAIACSSGTSALKMSLLAAGIEPGDKVIVPSLTFVATAQAVLSVNAVPILVDVDRATWTIDLNSIDKKLLNEAKFIIPVHLHGRLCDMEMLYNFAKDYNLTIIEDCAQSHGASRFDKNSGASGIANAFSFYPGKNLGALGEGGAVTTNSEEIAEKIRLLRNWGAKEKYLHEFEGSNERMDEIQGAFLNIKLKYLDEWTDKRTIKAKLYDSLFDEYRIERPKEDRGKHVYHIYSILVRNRDSIFKKLIDLGVGVGIHYPKPIHLQPFYQNKCILNSKLNNSETLSNSFLSVPLWESITKKQIHFIVEKIAQLTLK